MILPVPTLKAHIIDDDEIFVYGFKKLMQIKGITAETQEFGNGQLALDYLTNPFFADNLPDIIFLDINMPVMDGWEFLQNFEELQPRLGKKVSLYAVSSSVDINDINRAKNNPVITDYILKPINETYLTQIFSAHRSGDDLQQIS